MNSSSLWIVLQRMRIPFVVIVVTYSIAVIGLVSIDGVDSEGKPYNMSIFDAFYFVTYTATTIGFGEVPYEFTYDQRLFTSFAIYITVLGWFYGIGSLVSLLQDKLFINEIYKANFRRSVKAMKQDFIIVLGYNYITSEIIKKSMEANMRAVVIEREKVRADELILEGFTPSVPVLVSDAHSSVALEMAGIHQRNCKAVVSLFEDDELNLRIALTSKILNPHVKLAIKSTTQNHTENLRDIGVEIIENPFSIISEQIQLALKAPTILMLEKWLYQIDNLDAHPMTLPHGKYVVCGFGRMGNSLYNVLSENGIDTVFLDIDKNVLMDFRNRCENIIINNADDKQNLIKAGIEDAVAIIAATNDDTTNLSILTTAKKINPKVVTIVRENEIVDFSIFENSHVNHIFMPSKILIYKTTNALVNPISDKMVRIMATKDEAWGQLLARELVQKISINPIILELTINKNEACEVVDYLEKEGHTLKLDVFLRSRRNRNQHNNVVPLLIVRKDDWILQPQWDEEIKIGDEILFACDENAKDDIEYIANNWYEFYYIVTGKEKNYIPFLHKKEIF